MSTRSQALRDLADSLRHGAPPVPVVSGALDTPAPEGDPELLQDIAADFRKCAQTLDEVGVDLGRLRREKLPEVWPAGRDADAAGQRMSATEAHAERSGTVLAGISGCLTRLAGAISGAQTRDRAAREHIHTMVAVSRVAEPEQLDSIAASFADSIDTMADAAESAESAGIEAARLLNEHAGEATAGQLDTMSLTATQRLLLAAAADDLGAILSSSDARRAAAALDALTAEQRREFLALLDGAGSDAAQAWLLKSLAAGNDLATIAGFGGGGTGCRSGPARSARTPATPPTTSPTTPRSSTG